MYQQQVPQPRDDREWSGSPEAEYEAGYASNPANPQQTNQLADAIARRLQAQTPSTLQAPSFPLGQNPAQITANQRLALAIVSVVMLIPLSGVTLGILGAVGLIPLIILGVIILGVNVVFNNHK